MAKFAHYYLEYILDDMFAQPHQAEKQALFAALFKSNESIHFSIGEGEDKIPLIHQVTHLKANKDIIIMRIANEKTKEVVQAFKKKSIKHEPPCFVIIDNRKNCRRVAIQRNRDSFGSTQTVSRILSQGISEMMHSEYSIDVKLHPQYYPQDFYKTWRMNQYRTAKLRFSISGGVWDDKLNSSVIDDDTIMGFAQRVHEESVAKKYCTTLEVTPPDQGAILPVDEDDLYIRNLVNLHAATGAPIEIVTTDGSTYHCYIDDDAESNRIVTSELDTRIATALFENTSIDRDTAEAAILQFVNGMKYIVDSNEKRDNNAEGKEADA